MSLIPATDNPHIPLAYAVGPPARPGILTAVGIVSIVLGAISILASAAGIVTGLRRLRISKMRATMIARLSPSGAAPMPGYMNYTTNVHTTTMSGGGTIVTSTHASAFYLGVPAAASILTITEAALSLCVAALLIFAGIWMLRDSPAAGRLHRIYVALKIPLIALAAIATWWTTSGLMSSVTAMAAHSIAPAVMPTFGNMIAVIQAIVGAVFALLYPIALLIVLSSRTAKEHFNTL
jgi:hypothetical protein